MRPKVEAALAFGGETLITNFDALEDALAGTRARASAWNSRAVTERTVGLLHPGEMGAAIGRALRDAGARVVWASDGRCGATTKRAEDAGLEDVATASALSQESDVILSVCPPHAAKEVAGTVARFERRSMSTRTRSRPTHGDRAGHRERTGSSTAASSDRRHTGRGTTRLYLSGAWSAAAADLFDDTTIDAHVSRTRSAKPRRSR